MSHWLIRYTSPTGRTSLALEMPEPTARDIADRLHDATLLPVEDAKHGRMLAAALDAPAEVERIFARVRLAC